MLDGSDAVADWPILNALVNTAGGASWVVCIMEVALEWDIAFMPEW